MPTDQIFAGYTAYTETEEVLASTDVDPDELATTPTSISSVPCVNFTTTVTVAFSC